MHGAARYGLSCGVPLSAILVDGQQKQADHAIPTGEERKGGSHVGGYVLSLLGCQRPWGWPASFEAEPLRGSEAVVATEVAAKR